MFCHNCGAELKEQAKFCPRCGSGVYDPVSQTVAESAAPKENVVLGTVGAFAGGLLGIVVFLICAWNGIYPAFVGALMAVAISAGYDWLGKCRGTAGTAVVMILTAAVPLAAYLLEWSMVILEEYAGLGLSVLDGVGLLFLFIAQGQIDPVLVIQELLTLYGFAVLGAVLIHFWRKRRQRR